MNKIIWSKISFEQYKSWQLNDKRIVKKINELISSIVKDGMLEGIGNPQQLKHNNGYYRLIDVYNRLVYSKDNDDNLIIISCKGYYEY